MDPVLMEDQTQGRSGTGHTSMWSTVQGPTAAVSAATWFPCPEPAGEELCPHFRERLQTTTTTEVVLDPSRPTVPEFTRVLERGRGRRGTLPQGLTHQLANGAVTCISEEGGLSCVFSIVGFEMPMSPQTIRRKTRV